jgi:hypothetical protein
MGEVLIAGTASLLICVFLSPKFIDFLREREFGQQIREECSASPTTTPSSSSAGRWGCAGGRS